MGPRRKFAVGELARRRAADAPQRTVGAAKSWLCHSRVDRRQPILPWNAPSEVPKISPVTAARYYLDHLVAAWEAAHPDAPVAQQRVVLTVPASFDAAARELTREAALAAGLPADLILLEEPQAAVYAWLAAQGDGWRKSLHVGDRLLVCDVGGGTTDLTLIEVTEADGELQLQRLAVGDHLLVGGDNMDLALAYHVAERFAAGGHQLDPWQSVSLWHACRTAKETMLASDGPATHTISVLGRGSKLIGGTVSVEIDRDTVAQLLVDGFFPPCQTERSAATSRRVGFPRNRPAVRAGHGGHAAPGRVPHGARGRPSSAALPTHVLVQRRRVQSRATAATAARRAGQLELTADAHRSCCRANTTWITPSRAAPRITAGPSSAAACGSAAAWRAATTSASRRPAWPFPARRVRCGPCASCRSAWKKARSSTCPPATSAWCSANRPSSASSARPSARTISPACCSIAGSEQELVETDSLETVLPADAASDEPYVPVRFQSRITELGMFELWCVSTQSEGRWKLEFSVRDEGATG